MSLRTAGRSLLLQAQALSGTQGTTVSIGPADGGDAGGNVEIRFVGPGGNVLAVGRGAELDDAADQLGHFLLARGEAEDAAIRAQYEAQIAATRQERENRIRAMTEAARS